MMETKIKKILFLLTIFSMLAIPSTGSVAHAGVPLASGTLARVQGDDKLYYIDNGVKRYIDSPETFRIQGFNTPIQDVLPQDLAVYPLGDAITKDSTLFFPGQSDVVPDLAPFGPSDLQLVNRDGRQLLLFTTRFWNRGKGPMELDATSGLPIAPDTYETAQRVVLPNGSVRNKVVGNLFWHAIHNHFHYDNFASYVLEMIPKPGQTTAAPSGTLSPPMPGMPGMHQMSEMSGTTAKAEMTASLDMPLPPGLTLLPRVLGDATVAPQIVNKSTFCIFENQHIDLPTEGLNRPNKTYTICGKYKQGISVGWADVYPYTLPDQNFDVTNFPKGIYRLAFVVDPHLQLMEGSRENNVGVAFVDLNPQAGTMSVLAAGSPFWTPENHFPNGMLVRSENSQSIYIIESNKKRLLANPPKDQQVYILPLGVFNAIPNFSLIKVAGQPTVYALNDGNFRRGISSLEIFNSYGLNFADITEISAADLANYPETDLVQRPGDTNIYSISSRQSIGTTDSLTKQKLNPASVHTINQTDFESYMVNTVAADLFVPWDVALLPDGGMLVPERSGTLRRIGGKIPGVITIPGVLSTGEGGLMGVVLHPKFSQNNFIYVYFTTAQNGQHNRVVRYRLDGTQLADPVVMVDNIPSAIYHDGGRMAFGPDGMLYITTGDANNPNLAQDLNSLAGKTLRLTPEGQIPGDNPFGTAVWSYGHRNSQGIAWDSHGRMWETEHGRSGAASGFDELNIIEKGKNYGWPTIQGSETRAGMVTPVLNSGANETWAPSGMSFVDGSLYFSGLLGSTLYQVRFNGDGSFRDLQKHFVGRYGRLRAVVAGPDGSLYLSTSNKDGRGTPRGGDDKVFRVYPGLLQSFR
jgi:glucose/arabinose dehydrogenase